VTTTRFTSWLHLVLSAIILYWYKVSIWLSAIFLTKAGSITQVIPTTDGLTSYAGTTTTRHQLTRGEDPPHVVIRDWRYGPRWLRVDDGDDDKVQVSPVHQFTSPFRMRPYDSSLMSSSITRTTFLQIFTVFIPFIYTFDFDLHKHNTCSFITKSQHPVSSKNREDSEKITQNKT